MLFLGIQIDQGREIGFVVFNLLIERLTLRGVEGAEHFGKLGLLGLRDFGGESREVLLDQGPDVRQFSSVLFALNLVHLGCGDFLLPRADITRQLAGVVQIPLIGAQEGARARANARRVDLGLYGGKIAGQGGELLLYAGEARACLLHLSEESVGSGTFQGQPGVGLRQLTGQLANRRRGVACFEHGLPGAGGGFEGLVLSFYGECFAEKGRFPFQVFGAAR